MEHAVCASNSDILPDLPMCWYVEHFIETVNPGLFLLVKISVVAGVSSVGVLLLSSIINIFRANKLSKVDQFVMAYGGLRGAIAFSLVVLLSPELFPQQKLMVTTTTFVIFFTVFVQVSL